MNAASASAVAPAHIDALATGSPVSLDTSVWNSKIICRVPWLTSGWYGVYAV